jgi:hypothetical protein
MNNQMTKRNIKIDIGPSTNPEIDLELLDLIKSVYTRWTAAEITAVIAYIKNDFERQRQNNQKN